MKGERVRENQVRWTLSSNDNEGNIWSGNQQRISLTSYLLSFTLILCSWWCKSGSRRVRQKRKRKFHDTAWFNFPVSFPCLKNRLMNCPEIIPTSRREGKTNEVERRTLTEQNMEGKPRRNVMESRRQMNISTLFAQKNLGPLLLSWITGRKVLKPESELSEFLEGWVFGDSNDPKNEERDKTEGNRHSSLFRLYIPGKEETGGR